MINAVRSKVIPYIVAGSMMGMTSSCAKVIRPAEERYAVKAVKVSADTLKAQMLKVDTEVFKLKANKIPTPVDSVFVDEGVINLPNNADYASYIKNHPDVKAGVTLEDGSGVITTLLKQNDGGKIFTAFNSKEAVKQTYYPKGASYSVTRNIVPLKEGEIPKFYKWAGKVYNGFYQGMKYTSVNKK